MAEKKKKKGVYLITRVYPDFKEEFYKKCRGLGIKPGIKLRELAEKFMKK